MSALFYVATEPNSRSPITTLLLTSEHQLQLASFLLLLHRSGQLTSQSVTASLSALCKVLGIGAVPAA